MLREKTSIPTLPRWKSIRNVPRFLKDPLGTIQKNIAEYGKTYYFHIGGVHFGIFTADPALIQHVLQKNHRNYKKSPAHFDTIAHFLGNGLLTSEGPFWLRQRRLIQPGFHKDRLALLIDQMQDVIQEELKVLDEKSSTGPIDMYEAMISLTFNIIARSIFSQSFKEEELLRLSEHITAIQAYAIREIRAPFLGFWRKWTGELARHERMALASAQMVLELIEARRQSNTFEDDLLQMLLDARYEDDGSPMSAEQLLAEVNILFVAGHDTSANALSWTCYLLARHPEAMEKVRKETTQVLNSRRATFEDLTSLSYTRQVLEEAMRLYPPAWITDRIAHQDDTYQELRIPRGAFVITYIYGAHHDPDHWEDPEVFRPERFESKEARKNPAYLPFGAGPRLCIGNYFAMMEMQLAIINLVERYNFELLDELPPEPLALITLRPKNGLMIHLRKR